MVAEYETDRAQIALAAAQRGLAAAEAAKAELARMLDGAKAAQADQVQSLQARHNKMLAAQQAAHAKETAALQAAHAKEVEALKAAHAKAVQELEGKLSTRLPPSAGPEQRPSPRRKRPAEDEPAVPPATAPLPAKRSAKRGGGGGGGGGDSVSAAAAGPSAPAPAPTLRPASPRRAAAIARLAAAGAARPPLALPPPGQAPPLDLSAINAAGAAPSKTLSFLLEVRAWVAWPFALRRRSCWLTRLLPRASFPARCLGSRARRAGRPRPAPPR